MLFIAGRVSAAEFKNYVPSLKADDQAACKEITLLLIMES